MAHADPDADGHDGRPAERPDPRLAALIHRPLLLACVALLLGIVLARALHPGPGPVAIVCTAALVVTLATIRLAPAVAWAGLMLACLAFGGFRYEAASLPPAHDISRLAGARGVTIEGTVVSPPEERSWSRSFRLRVTGVVTRPAHSGDLGGTVIVRAPRATQVELGDRVRLGDASIKLPPTANEPGEFDYRAWLARQGVTALVSARDVEHIGSDTGWRLGPAKAGLALRERVVGSIDAAMPGRDAALYSRLLVGMVYGLEASPLPEEIVEEFRRAGTVHLLVVSGAQISMIAVAILGLTGARRLRNLRWWQAAPAMIGVLVLVLIVGMESSVTRAVAMFALLVLAGLTRRDYDVHTAIALSAAVICVFDPHALLSLSFQLTFAATLGVVLFLPVEPMRRLDNSPAGPPLPAVRAVLWGTLGAWVMTTPLLAHSFSGFAVSGNLANLVNVPLSFAVMLLGFLALPIALVPGTAPLLWLLCWAARGLLAMVMQVNVLAASLPVAFVRDWHLGLIWCVAWYVAVAAIMAAGIVRVAQDRLDRRLLRLHPMWPGVAAFAAAAILMASYLARAGPPRGMEVTVLPVGAGQCVIVRTPAGATLVADCGGGGGAPGGGDEVAEGTVIPFLARRGIERIDVLSISHWDADHYNALRRVLAATEVDLLLPPPTLPDARPPEWLGEHPAARAVRATTGGVLSLDGGVEVAVLAPRRPYLSGTRDDANNNSVVLLVRYGQVRFLLTGDIDGEGALRLLRDSRSAGRSLEADVLLLPHHGRHVARTTKLLDEVAPIWAVASCDRRADRYLDAEAVGEIERRGARLLRTDEDGTITFVTDGVHLRAATSRGELATGTLVAAARR